MGSGVDTESIILQLAKVQNFLSQLQKGDLPAGSKSAAWFAEFIQQLPWIIEENAASVGETQEDRPFQAQQSLINECKQYILLLQEILKNNPAGLAVVSGPDLCFRLFNTTYLAMLPNPQQDILGLPYKKVWSPEQGFDSHRFVHQMLKKGKDLHFDRIEQPYPDGLMRSFSLRLRHLEWHGEQGILILMQETTQADRARKLAIEIAGEAHRQAEELDAIITAMTEAITIYDANGMTTRANPAAIDLFGIDPVGLDRFELIELLSIRHPDGTPLREEEVPSERALRGETILGQHLLLLELK